MSALRGEQARVPSSTAMVLVDSGGRPLYYNLEAIAVLSYARQGKDRQKMSNFLPLEIRSLFCDRGANQTGTTEFTSGRRRYLCRSFALNSCSSVRSERITVLLLERESGKARNFSAVAERFRLTLRERELVGLLTLGLTSKEIAGRMNISPNTVKTFFHLVMTKMGVSTRAGIVGKIACA